MKKYRIKKIYILLILLILLIMILFFHKKNNSYSLDYSIDKYKISENYEQKREFYYYKITFNNIDYDFFVPMSYTKEKKLIKSIKNYKDQEYICLTINSDYFNVNPLCSENNYTIDYRLTSDEIKKQLNIKPTEEQEKTINNYTLYNNNSQIYIWEYKSLVNFADNKKIEIPIFNKDIYNINISTIINNTFFIADYNEQYNFNKVYLVDLNNNHKEEWKLDYDISFESYILGINNKSIYIVDKKNKIEYELVPHKKKMRIVGTSNRNGIIITNGNEEKISLTKLSSEQYSFSFNNNYNYTLKNEHLYLSLGDSSIKMLVSNLKIKDIVAIKNDEIYYLVDDTLYRYNINQGETKIIKYSEWNFNYENLIFINN